MASAADVERLLLDAIAHHEAGRFAQAEAGYEEVLARDGANVDALHFRGFLAFQRGEHERAAGLIEQAIALHPANARALHNLGNAYVALGRQADAAGCFERALALQPDLLEARYNLAIAYRQLGRRDEAAACLRELLQMRPDLPEAHFGLGHIAADEDRVADARTAFREALRLRPDYAEARWSAAITELPQVYALGEDPRRARAAFAAALGELEHWVEAGPPARVADAVGIVQPFSLAYQEEPNRELLERHGKLCVRVMSAWREAQGVPEAGARRPRTGRLRVAVVSAQLHSHSVWHALVKGWFRHLDPRRFALQAFHIGSGRDAETAFAAAHAERFEQDARGLRAWVDAILAAEPDVLIYPEIGMDPTALKLAALRLARVQLASWGHPETTGLPTIDCYLSAQDFEPPGAQQNYSERLVALPHLGCSFERRGAGGERPGLSALGIAAERPLLVCPGVPFKYAPQHDWIFPEIAARLGRCSFVFFTHWTRGLSQRLRERVDAAFAARGLDARRFVQFVPWLTNDAFQGLMTHADVYLDTIGFSGFNTALQALQCGLPVVTREGRFLRGRLASGILKRMGLSELVAASEAEYIALVERLVRDRPYRDSLARRLPALTAGLYEDRAPIAALEDFLANA